MKSPIARGCALALIALSLAASSQAAVPEVKIMRVPDGGIQPQAAVDAQGVVHLIYYKGKPLAGDIFYVRSTDDGESFSKAIRVNSVPDTAVATGTIRGPHMAIGKDSRIHVAWNGSRQAVPEDKRKQHGNAPMLYTRLNDKGTAFEPQRNLMTKTQGLDGGGSVAADQNGNVYVIWHGVENGKALREEERAVWVAHSGDSGQSFKPERRANREPTGTCGCCGLYAAADHKGRLLIMYRTATQFINRDMHLLVSTDQARSFSGTPIDGWKVGQCPMSSARIVPAINGGVLAWETNKHVYFQPIDNSKALPTKTKKMVFSKRNAKHPSVAVNSKGQALITWTEGTGWNRGGAVAWQVVDQDQQPIKDLAGRKDGVPAWSFPTTFQSSKGDFVILY